MLVLKKFVNSSKKKNLVLNFKKITKGQLFKSISIYGISNLINSSLPFLFLLVLTHYLTTSDYGIIANYQALFNLVLALVGYNVSGAIGRQYFEKHNINFQNYVANGMYILAFSILPLTLFFFIFHIFISKYTQIKLFWLYTIIYYSFTFYFIEILLSIWQVSKKPLKYGLFRVLRTLTELIITCFLVIICGFNWKGQIIGQITASTIFFVFALILFIKEKHLSHGFNFKYIINALMFGLPLILHVVGTNIMGFSDRILITKFVGISQTGLYSIGYQVGAIIGLIQNSFNMAWVPWFYEKLKSNDENINVKIVKFTYFYFAGLILLVVIFSFIAPFIFEHILGKAFKGGYVFVFWIALGFAFNGMYKMVVNYLFYLEKTYLIGLTTLGIALLNIGLNFYTIQKYGAIGAAVGCTISFFIQFLVIWILSAKMYQMPWFSFNKKQS